MSAVATHNPYQGMTPFAEPDAERFFGRKRWCHRLLDRLRDERRVLFLVGPSGCGKSTLLRTIAGLEDIGNVVLKTSQDGQPVLVKHVASVRDGAALRHGVITHNGEDEAVTGVIMMLLGSNSRDVIYAVKDRVAEIQASLPPGVIIETIYDRADFVERTLSTVMTNLVEGALVVFIVLVIFLGSIRGALVCVVGIPDAEWGETVCAVVELSGAEPTDETRALLLAHARASLAGYKVPRTIVFAVLPRTPAGKIRVADVRARFRSAQHTS